MTEYEFSCMINHAEKIDIFSCKFITDYLDKKRIPYDFDALIVRDDSTGRWHSFPEIVENDILRDNFKVGKHRECLILIYCPNENYISISKYKKDWKLKYITPQGYTECIIPTNDVIGKIAYYMKQNS